MLHEVLMPVRRKKNALELGKVDFLTISLNYFITRLLKQLDKSYFHHTSGNVVPFLEGSFPPMDNFFVAKKISETLVRIDEPTT